MVGGSRQPLYGLFIIEGVGWYAGFGVSWPGRGRGLPMMGVPTPSI